VVKGAVVMAGLEAAVKGAVARVNPIDAKRVSTVFTGRINRPFE